MKTKILVTALLVGVFQSTALAGALQCGVLFTGERTANLIQWRANNTNADQNGEVARTSSYRENQIRMDARQQRQAVQQNSTPLMGFYPEEGADMTYTVQTGGYQSGTIDRVKVTGLGPKGILKGTLTLVVSGHDGYDKAKVWAKTDKYEVQYQGGGKYTTLVKNVNSLDITTLQEVAIPLVKDQVVKILYNRYGSAGPGGFPEGRILELVWDGK